MRTSMVFGLLGLLAAGIANAEDNEAIARELKSKCDSECSSYMKQALGGSMRATYEAAACQCMCFYRGAPKDLPGRDDMKQCAIDNSREARQLGSTAPVLVAD